MASKTKTTRIFSRFYNAYQLVRNGHFSILFTEIKKRLYSESLSFGLQRDLNRDFEARSAKINFHIRPLNKDDVDELLKNDSEKPVNPRITDHQRALAEADIPTCYVAVTAENKPCYMQWLIGYENNNIIENYFEGVFPRLKESEALLEGAYSNPGYRGLGIMPAAMAQIAEKAADLNARWVNTFVDITNIPSLKGCRRAGFEPYVLRKDKWFLFRRNTSFHPIPENLIKNYHRVTADKARVKDEEKKLQTHTDPESKVIG